MMTATAPTPARPAEIAVRRWSGAQTKQPSKRDRFEGCSGFDGSDRQTRRSTIIFLISAIAFAGLRPFGQVFEQFMMVWQR